MGEHLEDPAARRLDGKKFKSGRAITCSLNEISDVSWPHMKALPRVTGRGDIKFDEMTHWEFIEGELLIIDDPLTPEIEKKLRYSHLQEVVRYASMFPWRAIPCYHGAFLEELEQGRRDWSDQKSDLKERYLYPYSRNSVSGKSESAENIQFCYDYQKDSCTREKCKFKHICKQCYTMSGKLEYHPGNRCPSVASSGGQEQVDMDYSYRGFILACQFIILLLCLVILALSHFAHVQFKQVCAVESFKCKKPCRVPFWYSWDGCQYEVTNTWCCDGNNYYDDTRLLNVEVLPRPKCPWPPIFVGDIFNVVWMSEQVRMSGEYNFQKCKINVPSGLNICIWKKELANYHDKVIVDYLNYGWPIGYDSNVFCKTREGNHKSALDFYESIDKYITNELKYGAMAGPFHSNPFSCRIAFSPFQTVPKEGESR